MDRTLDTQVVSGEVGLVIDYRAGSVLAVDILQAAVGMIEALDGLDRVLLSSVDTSLEPVSVLNDVERSSLKMILARALRSMPDDQLRNLEFKKWLGELLVAGKYKLLFLLDSNAPQIQNALAEKTHYRQLVGHAAVCLLGKGCAYKPSWGMLRYQSGWTQRSLRL